jgi:hypothetical protein
MFEFLPRTNPRQSHHPDERLRAPVYFRPLALLKFPQITPRSFGGTIRVGKSLVISQGYLVSMSKKTALA